MENVFNEKKTTEKQNKNKSFDTPFVVRRCTTTNKKKNANLNQKKNPLRYNLYIYSKRKENNEIFLTKYIYGNVQANLTKMTSKTKNEAKHKTKKTIFKLNKKANLYFCIRIL